MLFLGTEDYPDENYYSKFLQENGGNSNAFTSTENTNYYFDVLQDHLSEVLKVFSAFFVNPLFTDTMTSRELNAVNSENAKNLLNDMWRSFQLSKSTADSDHPFSKFGTGNKQTLETDPAANNINVRDVLLTFHQTWYSSSIMKLCVLGRESLDDLQAMIDPLFSRIRNNNVAKQTYKAGSPYTSAENIPRRLNVVPIKDLRTIEIGWPTHGLEEMYRKKPAGYCSHIIGHEGPGSLFALLKKEGLADALSAGMFQSNSSFGMFAISVDATEEGMSRVDDIVNYCYQYIKMFRDSGSPEWIFKESQLIADNSFRFKEKRNPSSYVQSISSNMKTYAVEDILCGSSLYFEYDPTEIQKIMACLIPSNMRLQCTSRKYEGTTTLEEKWYHTKYSNIEISKELLKEWSNPSTMDPRLHLPKPNKLIAKEFELRCEMKKEDGDERKSSTGVIGIVEGPPRPVTNIEETDIHSIWHKEDNEYGVPKCVIYINLINPITYDSPKSTVLSALYSDLVKDALNEYSYDASIAGLQYELINSTKGLQLIFFGYNDVMPSLLSTVTDTMKAIANGIVNEDRLKLIIDRTILELKNFNQDQPYQHSMYNMNYMTRSVRWHNNDKLVALENDIDLQTFKSFSSTLLKRLKCEVMIHGNMSKTESIKLVRELETSLDVQPLCSAQFAPLHRCVQYPLGSSVHRANGSDPENPESAIQASFQINPTTYGEDLNKLPATLAVLSHLMKEPCYDILRTKEQLGYMVWSGASRTFGIYSLWFIIQSPEKGPSFLDQRIEAFLTHFKENILLTMKDETFKSNIQACILTRTKKDVSLYAQSGRFWKEIEDNTYKFNRKFLTADVLSTITKDDVISLFDNYMVDGTENQNTQKSKMSTHIVGKDKSSEDDPLFEEQVTNGAVLVGNDTTSMDLFKRSRGLYPTVKNSYKNPTNY